MTKTAKARLFTNGGSQAVRLPAEFRFTGTETVYVRRNAAGEVVLSARSPSPYAAFMAARDAIGVLDADFLSADERGQRSEPRDPLADDAPEAA